MMPEIYGTVANIILVGITAPTALMLIISKKHPDIHPALFVALLGEAAIAIVMSHWWVALLFVLIFGFVFVRSIGVIDRWRKTSMEPAEHLPRWARNSPSPEGTMTTLDRSQRMIEAPRTPRALPGPGYHRPERVAERTGEIPQLKRKS